MSKRHRVGRNVRGGVAAGAVLAAVALTAGAAYSSASASPATVLSCADAINAYQAAQDKLPVDKAKLDAANKAFDDATAALAKAKADAVDPKSPEGTIITPAEKLIIVQAESTLFRAGEARSSAQHIYDADLGAANNAKAAADTACQGPAGPGGVSGAVGPKGVDARIVLAPTVCARAIVTPNPERLVRVIALIPCPATVPAPPVAEPRPGDEVVVIPPAAPVPPVKDAHLPVTG
jgi:hypothetical protein